MKSEERTLLQTLVPFLVAGVAIALLLGLLFVFAYVLVWGLIIGGVLWVAYAIKRYFFPSKEPKVVLKKKDDTGRIIEHDDK